MKKTILVIGLAVAFALLLAPAALADNGPHGGYTATNTPDGCAACHRTHTAQGAMLLKDSDTLALCESCHGTAASGAQTNVVDGVYAEGVNDPGGQGTPGGGLRAGGFVNTVMNTDFSLTAGSHAVTSAHSVDGTAGTVWGYGAISATHNEGVEDFELECTTCHNPHGNSGPNGEATYRILRSAAFAITPAATTKAWVEDTATKSYTVLPSSLGVPNNYFYNGMSTGEFYTARGTVQTTLTLSQQITNLCAQCHTRYAAPGGSYAVDSGDALYKFRHAAHSTSSVGCLTCHTSHGTSSGATALAAGASLANDSALLRLDNRGVCANCHAAEWVRGQIASMTPSTITGSTNYPTTSVAVVGTNLTWKNAAGAELVGGKVRLTLGAVSKYATITAWSNTGVTFTLPADITAGSWQVRIVPNGLRDSDRRTPLWPIVPPATTQAAYGILTLN